MANVNDPTKSILIFGATFTLIVGGLPELAHSQRRINPDLYDSQPLTTTPNQPDSQQDKSIRSVPVSLLPSVKVRQDDINTYDLQRNSIPRRNIESSFKTFG